MAIGHGFDLEVSMTDFLLISGTLLFFVASVGFVALCARLMEEKG